jgi:hypothetical protein
MQRCLRTAQPVGRRQSTHQEGEQDMDPYSSPRFLWRMASVPLLFGLVETTVLNEAAHIIVINVSTMIETGRSRILRLLAKFQRAMRLAPWP